MSNTRACTAHASARASRPPRPTAPAEPAPHALLELVHLLAPPRRSPCRSGRRAHRSRCRALGY
eukprot:9431970-Heterocapsa_arctica.AAC.1